MNEKIEIDANFLANLEKAKQSREAIQKKDDEFESFMLDLVRRAEDTIVFSALEKFSNQLGKEQSEFFMGCVHTLNKYGVPAKDTLDCLIEVFKLFELYENTFEQKGDDDD